MSNLCFVGLNFSHRQTEYLSSRFYQSFNCNTVTNSERKTPHSTQYTVVLTTPVDIKYKLYLNYTPLTLDNLPFVRRYFMWVIYSYSLVEEAFIYCFVIRTYVMIQS